MARLTLRAVEQPDGWYRISITPATPEVDVHRAYSREEVRQLAERIHAEVRWDAGRDETSDRPEMVHEVEPSLGGEPPDPGLSQGEPSAQSEDLWGGTLSAGNEE